MDRQDIETLIWLVVACVLLGLVVILASLLGKHTLAVWLGLSVAPALMLLAKRMDRINQEILSGQKEPPPEDGGGKNEQSTNYRA